MAQIKCLLFVVAALACVSVEAVRAQTLESASHLATLERNVPSPGLASTQKISEPRAAAFTVHIGIHAAKLANSDSTSPLGSREAHVKVAALSGAAVVGITGAVVGLIVDQRASDARVQVSGGGVVLGVEGALAGALLGGIVGAFMPHS
jgi:hypothetical protein